MSFLTKSLNVVQKEQSFRAVIQEFFQHFLDGNAHVLQKGEAAVTCDDCQVETGHYKLWERSNDPMTKVLIAIPIDLGDTVRLVPTDQDNATDVIRTEQQDFEARIYVRTKPNLGGENEGYKTLGRVPSLVQLIVNNFKWALGEEGIRRVKISGATELPGTDQYIGALLTLTGRVNWIVKDTIENP